MKHVRGGFIIVFLALLLAACSQQQPSDARLEPQRFTWTRLGGALDIVDSHNSVQPKLLLDRNGKLVVVWAEDNGLWYLQARRWNGTSWEKLPIPSKPLPYTSTGVNAFDAAFDSSNAFVVSVYGNYGRVQVSRTTGSSWTALTGMGFTGLTQLETNASGEIHAVFQSKITGNNYIKRWTGGLNWQIVATFNKTAYDSPDAPYIYAESFALRADGKPVLEAPTFVGGYGSDFFTWTGLTWLETHRGRYMHDYALNSSTYLITATSFYGGGTELEVTGTTQDAGLFDGDVSLAIRNDQPLLLYFPRAENNKLTAKLWTGSSWTKLAGRLERDPAKIANESDILVDKQGKIFVVWQEAACVESASCGGGNIYVSRYALGLP